MEKPGGGETCSYLNQDVTKLNQQHRPCRAVRHFYVEYERVLDIHTKSKVGQHKYAINVWWVNYFMCNVKVNLVWFVCPSKHPEVSPAGHTVRQQLRFVFPAKVQRQACQGHTWKWLLALP